MAIDDPVGSDAHPLPMTEPIKLDPILKKRPRWWWRWIRNTILAILVLFIGIILLGVIVGKQKDTDVTSVMRDAASDQKVASEAGITGNIVEGLPAVLTAPPGFKANFQWIQPASGAQVNVATFDTDANAAAAFELFKGSSPGSLIAGPEEGTTIFGGFSRGLVGTEVKKQFNCAQREHLYSCGSIPIGIPAIVTIRLPMEANWDKPAPEDEDPLAGLERTFGKTNKMADEMMVVDKSLQRLGLDVRVLEKKN
jgi:hypothetical protein